MLTSKTSSYNYSVPKRVLFLIPTLQGGGAERVFVTILKHINRLKFEPILAVVSLHDSIYQNDVPKDVQIIDLKCESVTRAVPKIIYLIWTLKLDVVFTTLGHLNLALALLRPLLPRKIRYVARESSIVSRLPIAYNLPFWWFWAYKKFYKKLDLLVCQSFDMAADLVNNFDFPRDKVVTINNPFDADRISSLAAKAVDAYPPDKSLINVVAAGRLSFEKGYDILIKALKLTKNSNIHLTILGDGSIRGELLELISNLSLNDRVRLLGFQSNPYPYLANADVFVLSSRFDGFPNVVLEALACGTPIISTPALGGVYELIDGVEGCIITQEISAQSLAEALNNFRPGYRILPEVVQSFSAEYIVPKYEAAFLGTCA